MPHEDKSAAGVRAGLPDLIDVLAEKGPSSHSFLRRQWFAAAVETYGGSDVRTVVVQRDGEPIVALPIITKGPAAIKVAAVPGCYWPFRSFPLRADANDADGDALINVLSEHVRVLRVGPIYDGDPALAFLKAAAERNGWIAIDRLIGETFVLDMHGEQDGKPWPRTSTLKRNRFHEKHLADDGALRWSFQSGAEWDESTFADMAAIEEKSWIASRTDGSDAKFTRAGHGAFWQAVMQDPVLAKMLWAATLHIGDAPAAFSFDLNAGALKYAIANSYDPAFGRQSPGRMLYYRNLVQAKAEGMRFVDWGAGDSGYKRVMGAQEGTMIRDWLFVRPGLPAAAARMFSGLWRGSAKR